MLGNNGGDPAAAESGGSSGGDGGAPPESSSGGGNRWPRQETVALIDIRRDMDVTFRDASLKGPLWEEVSRKLGEFGYHRSAKKCKEKFENVFKYHKRTKDSRGTKSEGKTYRFFDQLEALDSQPTQSQPPPPRPPHSHQAATQATPLSIAMPATSPTAAPPFTTTNNTTVSSAQNLPQLQNTISIPKILAPIGVHSTNSFPLNTLPPQPNPFSISFSTPIPPSNQNPISMSSPSSTSSDEEPERWSKRKRKWVDFFERLTSEVMAKQEEMQKKFLEALEKREQERIARDEAWRAQELARMSREREILAQERAVAAAKDAALFAFLQKVSASDQQIPNPSQTPQQNNMAPRLPTPSEPVQQNPPPQLLPQPPVSAPTPVQQTPPPPQLRPQPPASMPALLQQTPPPPQHTPQSPVSAPTPVSALPPLLPPPPSQLQLRLLQSVHSSKKMNTDSGGEIVNFNPNPSSSRWPKTEIEALIKLRTNLDLKYQENVPKGPLWEEISAGMLRLGYNRNAKRCKEKWENINKYYKKVKESNKKRPEDSKTCPYFSQLDAIYKERAKSETHFKQENVGAPIMAQPEQQWPIQSRPELPLMEGHDSDDDMDDDDDDEDEAGKYELVTNKPSSVGTTK